MKVFTHAGSRWPSMGSLCLNKTEERSIQATIVSLRRVVNGGSSCVIKILNEEVVNFKCHKCRLHMLHFLIMRPCFTIHKPLKSSYKTLVLQGSKRSGKIKDPFKPSKIHKLLCNMAFIIAWESNNVWTSNLQHSQQSAFLFWSSAAVYNLSELRSHYDRSEIWCRRPIRDASLRSPRSGLRLTTHSSPCSPWPGTKRWRRARK